MKKLFSITLSALMACSLVACSSSSEATTTPTSTTEATVEPTAEATSSTDQSSGSGMPNPWTTCDSLEDAEKLAGFEFTLPTSEDIQATYSAVEGQLIEVVYDADGDDPLVVRKGVGSDDLSGDYTTYDVEGTLTVGEITVNYKGESEDVIHNAIWTSGDYSYSIYSPIGVTTEALSAFVEQVK